MTMQTKPGNPGRKAGKNTIAFKHVRYDQGDLHRRHPLAGPGSHSMNINISATVREGRNTRRMGPIR